MITAIYIGAVHFDGSFPDKSVYCQQIQCAMLAHSPSKRLDSVLQTTATEQTPIEKQDSSAMRRYIEWLAE